MEELIKVRKFVSLEAKIAAALNKIIHGELSRQIGLLKERLSMKETTLLGRQVIWFVYEHYKTSQSEGAILDFTDLMAVKHDYKNLRGFLGAWESCLQGMASEPDKVLLETLFLPQLEKDESLQPLLTMYKLDISQRGYARSYTCLMGMVQTELTERRRKHVRDAKAGKGGAIAGALTDGNLCRNMLKSGKCARGDQCPYNHKEALKQFKKGGGKSNSDKGGGKDRGRSPGEGKDRKGKGKGKDKGKDQGKGKNNDRSKSPARGKSPSGQLDCKPCFDFVKGKCEKGDKCNYWHQPACKAFKEGNCKYGNDCRFSHAKPKAAVAQVPVEDPKPKKQPRKRGKSPDGAAGIARFMAFPATSNQGGPAKVTFPRWVQDAQLKQEQNGARTLQPQEGEPRHVSAVPRTDQEQQETLESARYDAYQAWCDLHDHRVTKLSPTGRMPDGTTQPLCKNFADGTCSHGKRCKFYHHFPPTHEYLNFTQDVEDIPAGKIPYRNKHWVVECVNTTCGETSSATADSEDNTSTEDLEAEASDGECQTTRKYLYYDEREYILDTGASYHLIARCDLTPAEVQTLHLAPKPITLSTADKPIVCKWMVWIYVGSLDLKLEAYVGPGEHRPLIGLVKLCRESEMKFLIDGDSPPELEFKRSGKIIRSESVTMFLPLRSRGSQPQSRTKLNMTPTATMKPTCHNLYPSRCYQFRSHRHRRQK